MANTTYSEVKKVLWRYFRIFVDGLLGALTAEIITRAVGMDYEEGIKFVVAAAFAGGFAALSKTLRERSDSKDLTSAIHKIPF